MEASNYQVIVIGGGHAGVEAAWAAANLLALGYPGSPSRASDLASTANTRPIALITLDPAKIGEMSCNPAIGGLAKGQLVREIDAMGGLMALAADATGIQFKVLNQSKGPAVHGPRAQCDKHAYAEAVRALIASRPEIQVIAASVERLIVEDGRCVGVRIGPPPRPTRPAEPRPSGSGSLSIDEHPQRSLTVASLIELRAPAVVLTTGTFMRGLMHTGESKTPGGRFGEGAAVGISGALRDLGFELGRLKTGTPPRLKRDSIRWNDLDPQYSDATPRPFSDLSLSSPRCLDATLPGCRLHDPNKSHTSHATYQSYSADGSHPAPSLARFPVLAQIECRQTSTTAAAHDHIRANLHRAPMYSGQIESVGPRYCPSIEDKVVRFADRLAHGVFLEPESLRTDWIYCNGISTSLPSDVQDAIVRSMPGCEQAVIYRYGYAVEYDMVRPHQIRATGETKLVAGLFLAGQINGTSGYEEAAAQGLIAGLNAARRALGQPEFILGREQAYLGVLMDDLVTKTPVEPYRMFTSRAEHRLLLRSDNAADRLTPLAEELGLLSSTELGRRRRDLFRRRREHLDALNRRIDATRVGTTPLDRLIRTEGFEVEHLKAALAPHEGEIPDSIWHTVHAERRYAPFIARQTAEIKRHAEIEHRRLPDALDYHAFTNLRTEARLSLARFRPSTFGQAARLEGITPADLTLLSVLVKRWTDERRAPVGAA